MKYFHQLRYAGQLGVQLATKAVGRHHSLVVLLVSLPQFQGHGSPVIEVGKAGARVKGTGVKNCLGGLLDFGLLCIRGGGPEEVVVNNGIRTTIIPL